MTREDIEGRDQETDDDGEILIPCTNPASCACGKATGECRPSGPRPPDHDRLSPEQWWTKRRVSAIGRRQYTKLTRVLAQLPHSDGKL